MVTVEIFDPALCCSTGVCGPSVDPELVRFAADVAWLGSHGVKVLRYNLAQQPGDFAANATITALLREKGTECLPVVLVDGAVFCEQRYPGRDELGQKLGIKVHRTISIGTA
jgi:hypothetical protein